MIADMSVNFLERQVLRRGHQLVRVPQPEYGTDALMLHFSPNTSEIENGWVEYQVKATDYLSHADGRQFVTCTIEKAHLHYWYWELQHPFILVLYDARKNQAYWLDVKEYVDRHSITEDSASETITIRIPATNKLTLRAIDRFRSMSLARATTS